MARKHILNQDGTPNWDTIAGFKERLDGHDISVASNTSSLASMANIQISIERFPRNTGETDDAPRIQRAINSLSLYVLSAPGGTIRFPKGTYTINSTVNVNLDFVRLIGDGFDTVFQNGTNTTMFLVTNSYDVLADLYISCTDANRTNYPIKTSGATRPLFKNVYFNGVSGSWASGLYLSTGSMAIVTECQFNHSNIRVETWDVKIDKCYIWAMSCPFGIGIYNGTGNTTITNTDIVPPLTSTTGGLAGIYVDGASGAAYNTKIIGCYLDGNPSLQTGKGIYLGNSTAVTLIQGCNANKMDSDVIVIDSAINTTVANCVFYNNNDSGLGGREIAVLQTGAQSTEGVLIENNQFLMTRDVPTSPTGKAPTIFVDTAKVSGSSVKIRHNYIKQQSTLGGYSDPEISCDATKTDLEGNFGTASVYSASGSISVASGATNTTINLSSGYPMAYQPLSGDIQFNWEGNTGPTFRLQYTNRNQVFIAFASALTANATLVWKARLSK